MDCSGDMTTAKYLNAMLTTTTETVHMETGISDRSNYLTSYINGI